LGPHLVQPGRLRAGRDSPRTWSKPRSLHGEFNIGDGHSASFDDTRALLFTADEDFCKNSGPQTEKGFGYMRVYDYSERGAPVQIGE
jgi:hypothetical protein